ncbi:hypothetical protein EAI89_04810 [Eubacterium sp. am_0171]|nr:hypothetical protein EAI89_04810 [Eubacterium sp. am_0171]
MRSGMSRDKKGWGLDATRPRRSPNAKETVHEGTYNMQRESLMLSRLRLYWEVILENHFPSLMDGFFYVRTSNRGLYASSPHPFLSRDIPLHIPGRLDASRQTNPHPWWDSETGAVDLFWVHVT